MANIKDIKLGTTQVKKAFLGNSLIFEYVPPDVTPPTTTPSVSGGNYTNTFTVYLNVNEPSTTYYTTNGSTPTTSSTKYTGGIAINQTTTLKYFSVDTAGNKESVKTTTYNLDLRTKYRYVRFIGYGDQTSTATTRLVEFRAMSDGVNRIAGKLPISGETPNAGSGVANATDGSMSMSSGTYPIWWTGAGVPTLTYDMGASYPLDELQVWMFSTTNDPRATKFILQASTNNSSYTTIANWSNNGTTQPSGGWIFDAQTKSLK